MHTPWDQVVTTLEGRFGKGAALMTGAKEEVLAFTAFPSEHCRQLWSTNPFERLNKELKRRCRVVGIFPNEASVIRLGGAVLLDVHDESVSAERRYFSEVSMAKLYRVVDNDHASVKELSPLTDCRRGLHAQSPPFGGTPPDGLGKQKGWGL